MKRAIVVTMAVMAMVVFSLMGCVKGLTPQPLTVCQEYTDESLLEKYIPDLRLANTMFKLSLYEVAKVGEIKQAKIAAFLDEAEAIVDSSGTYADFATYIMSKVKWFQENFGAEIIIIGDDLVPFQGISTPISQKDRCYLKAHIAEQRAKVLPWIPRTK